MADYDLKSLNLPKLYSGMLSLFTNLVTSPVTRPLIIGSLLETAGFQNYEKWCLTRSQPFFLWISPKIMLPTT